MDYLEGIWTVKQLFVRMHLHCLYPHLASNLVGDLDFSMPALYTPAKVIAQVQQVMIKL